MENNRVVIDTNVFISALLVRNSFSDKIFEELVLTYEVKICLSTALLAEYENVSSRDKFKKIQIFRLKHMNLLKY